MMDDKVISLEGRQLTRVARLLNNMPEEYDGVLINQPSDDVVSLQAYSTDNISPLGNILFVDKEGETSH